MILGSLVLKWGKAAYAAEVLKCFVELLRHSRARAPCKHI